MLITDLFIPVQTYGGWSNSQKFHLTFLKLGRCKMKDLVGKIACHYTHVNSTMFSGLSNQLNNTEHERKHQKNSIAANFFSEAFDHDKISLNFTQHSTTSTTC